MSTADPGPHRPATLASPFLAPYDPLYPDSDGEPRADSTLQFKWIVVIKEGLDALFLDRDDVFIAGDLLWYATQGEPKDCVAPDVMVAFSRPRGHRRSYKQWFEAGVAPQVVFEIDSPSNTAAEMARKLRIYDARGVEEYYYYDPETGALKAWLRGPKGLRAVRKVNGWTSPRLDVSFHAPRRKDALVLRGPDGRAFRTFGELSQDEKAARRIARIERRRRRETERLLDEAETRARAEQQLREEAQANAKADRDRAERLAARLRELGLEAD